MLNIFSNKQAKQSARALERFLAAKGVTLKHGEALDALGHMSGHQNWAALTQSLGESVVDRELKPHEISHALGCVESEAELRASGQPVFDNEVALTVHTGFQVRFPDFGEELDYVRVCDPIGREIAYWSDQELNEAPIEIMRAVFGHLGRGRAIRVSAVDRQKDQRSLIATTEAPSILDVPFPELSGVVLNSEHFNVRWTDDDQLARLASPAVSRFGESDDDIECEDAMELSQDDDGLVTIVAVSVATLRSLTWDTDKKEFVDPASKDTYRFILAMPFGH